MSEPVDHDQPFDLTDSQRISILQRALKILGPKGQNWMKGSWFGKKANLDENQRILPECETLVPYPKSDAYCLLGALEVAAFQLGLTTHPEVCLRMGEMTSLNGLLRRRGRAGEHSTIMFNDRDETTFEDVKTLVTNRLAELQS